MIAAVELIAGLGWDPEIRGLLTVVLAMAVLGGSVWLLLVTNTGTRLGSLIAIAGFWGWMFVMGIFWWIYGIGWAGSLPSWEVQDVFIDPAGVETEGLQEAFVGNVDQLPDGNCFTNNDGQPASSFPPADGVGSISLNASSPTWALCTPRAIEVVMAYDGDERNSIIQELLNPQNDEAKISALAADMFGASGDNDAILASLSASQRDQLADAQIAARTAELEESAIRANIALGSADPRFLRPDELNAKIDEDIANAMLRIDDISLSQLEALAPQVNEWAEDQGLLRLSGWDLQSTSQSGEAAATADAFLREELFPDGDFVVLDAYQQGGKPKRDGTDMWTRIKHKFTSTARITHPTNYTVVSVQQTIEKIADPAKPPPVPEIRPAEPTYSVVMTRNLGNLRLIPGLFTVVSLILFLLSCLVLHWRDLGLREKGVDV